MKNVHREPARRSIELLSYEMEDRFGLPSQDCCNVKAPPVGVDVTVLRDFGDAANATKTIPAREGIRLGLDGGWATCHTIWL